MRGLIIRKPWLDQVMSGEKTLEIRGSNSSHVGEPIALIEGGSSIIRGFCVLEESIYLTEDLWYKEMDNHLVDCSYYEITCTYYNPYGWRFKDVVPCSKKVKYKHPSGAVIWVNLDNVQIKIGDEDYKTSSAETMKRLYDESRGIILDEGSSCKDR